MNPENLPQEFLERLRAIKGKRSKIVVDHILKHGFITTEDLAQLYGYKHPPRAIRDVREQGIPLESFSVKNRDGLTISAYRFGDPALVRQGQLTGRRVIPKAFKQALIEAHRAKCSICGGNFEGRYFQVDHRVPYEIAGEAAGLEITEFMLVCASCNRAKSWSCEHCPNWHDEKSPTICQTCYWANPTQYDHIARQAIRRLDIIWADEEIEIFDAMKKSAETYGESLPNYVKKLLEKQFKSKQGE